MWDGGGQLWGWVYCVRWCRSATHACAAVMHRTTLQRWLQVSGHSRLLARCAAASPNCSLSLLYRCPGLIKDPSANQLKLAPSHFGRLAAKACSTGLQQLPSVFPKV